jgi:hypothetical protein
VGAWKRISVETFGEWDRLRRGALLNASTHPRFYYPPARTHPHDNLDHSYLHYHFDTWSYEIPTNKMVYSARITRIEVGIAKFVHLVRTLKRVSPQIFLFFFVPRLTPN